MEMIDFLDVPVIAADGAANFLHEIGVVPDYIIGDSTASNEFCYASRDMIQLTEQETCDFEKSHEIYQTTRFNAMRKLRCQWWGH